MTKYYRVRTSEQWDWLNNKLKEHHKCHSTCPYDELLATRHGHVTDTTCGVVVNNSGLIEWGHYQELGIIHCASTSDFIEVSDLMEDEKMEDYVTIKGEDVEKLKNEQGDSLFFMSDKQHFVYSFIEGFDCSEVNIPKSLLYPKVPMTEAEKKEFDELKNELTAHIYDLDDLLTKIRASDYPHLYHRLYVADGDGVESQLEFARAWADESLIEVIPEKKWNVKVPFIDDEFYYKNDDGGLYHAPVAHNHENNQQFTAEEIKYYHLDNDLFEKVEVKE